MKPHRNRISALILAFVLCLQLLSLSSFPAAAADTANQPELIYSASDLNFPDETTDYNIENAGELFSSLTAGTFIFSFTPTSEAAVQSLIGLSDPTTANSHFHIYINTRAKDPTTNVDRNLLGFEIRRQSGGDILKDNTPVEIELGKQHIVAMSADPVEGYKLFFDGVCVYHMPVGFGGLNYGFLNDIPSITAGHIGGTERSNAKKYPYVGGINSVAIYNGALSDDELLAITGQAPVDPGIVNKTHLFNFGDWNSPGLRIPSIIRTDNDVLIASADIRFGNSDDPPNNCDIGIRTSTDGGATWSEPRMLLNFLDYPNEPSPDQPCKNSASYCDSVLVKGENNRVFLFVDAMKGNISAPSATPGSGYIEVDGIQRLALCNSGSKTTDFYVGDYAGETAPVFETASGEMTSYSVGKHFELYENGEEISNIFYLASPLQVVATVFSLVIYTDDDGQTWSAPTMMNPIIKESNMLHCGTAPGVGIQIQNGLYKGRLLVPYYYNTTSATGIMNGCLVYSDDNGATWMRGGSPNDGRSSKLAMGEIQVVEMPFSNGETISQLKMFIRVKGHALIATSLDGGVTWLPDVETDSHLIMSATSGCQMSVIRYSSLIDGNESVIFSNPAALNRSNGAIQIGAIVKAGTYEDGTPKYAFRWDHMRVIRDGDFGYSCLVELPNGNIGILYEEQSKKNSVDHLTYAEFTLDYLKNKSTDEPTLIYSAKNETLPHTDGSYTEIAQADVNKISVLNKGTILVRFKPADVTTTQSLIGISNGTVGSPNSYFHLYYSNSKLGFEIRRQSGGDFEKNFAAVTIEAGKEYCAAITADPAYGYQLFLNGELVLDLPLASLTTTAGYGFIRDIPGINSAYLGKTHRVDNPGRPAAFEYPFTGTIETLQVYDGALSTEHMKQTTYVVPNDTTLYSDGDVITPEATTIDADSLAKIAAMHSGTIVVEFTPYNTSSVHSLIGINDNLAGYPNSYFHLYISAGKLGYEIRRQSGGDFMKSSVSADIALHQKHTVAFVADPNSGYKLFFDGALVQTISPSQFPSTGYGFISDIPNISAGYLGKTDRNGGNQYPYSGSIDNIKVYSVIIPDNTLTAWTTTGGF